VIFSFPVARLDVQMQQQRLLYQQIVWAFAEACAQGISVVISNIQSK
jgi:hypothetical protein